MTTKSFEEKKEKMNKIRDSKGRFIKINKENELIKCNCGKCGLLRPKYDKYGVEREYINGHQNKGIIRSKETRKKANETKKRLYREGKLKISSTCFKKGNKPWNKDKKNVYSKERIEQISKSKIGNKYCLGKKLSKQTREKQSLARIGRFVGEKSPSWLGGISFEPYTIDFNKQFKREIRKRDNYVCLKCGKHQEKENKSLCIHHINYNKKLTIKENCCSLCHKCNLEVNFNRLHWTKFFQSLLSERYEYKYSENGEVILNIENGKT